MITKIAECIATASRGRPTNVVKALVIDSYRAACVDVNATGQIVSDSALVIESHCCEPVLRR